MSDLHLLRVVSDRDGLYQRHYIAENYDDLAAVPDEAWVLVGMTLRIARSASTGWPDDLTRLLVGDTGDHPPSQEDVDAIYRFAPNG